MRKARVREVKSFNSNRRFTLRRLSMLNFYRKKGADSLKLSFDRACSSVQTTDVRPKHLLFADISGRTFIPVNHKK
jgi:hypothetical protein